MRTIMTSEQAERFDENYFGAGGVRQSRSLTRAVCEKEVLSWLKREYPRALGGAGRRALEIGCGYGYTSELLAEYGYQVLGTDISSHAIEKARAEVTSPDVEFAVWDAGKGVLNGEFDLIIALEVIEHLPDPESALRSWARLLRPGGVLLS